MKTHPLLSIVIPTKNRYNTLIPVIEAILQHVSSDDYEIVVQDNSDSNTLAIAYIEEHKDPKLQYFYTQAPISISKNTTLAIENANGQYLTFIGDDDLVSPYIVDIANTMAKEKIRCLIGHNAYYWWDNVIFKKKSHYHMGGALWIPQIVNTNISEIISEEALSYALQNGAVNLGNLPRFYHGIVARDVLEAIKEKTGTYVPGTSPDMSFAISIAMILEKYHYIKYPITVYGGSQNSGAGWGARKSHYGKIEDQKFLPDNILERWDINIPKIWSANTTYAQTAGEILQLFRSNKKVNYIALYSSMLVNEPQLWKYILPKLRGINKQCLSKYTQLSYYLLRKLIGRVLTSFKIRTKRFGYDVHIEHNVNNCMERLRRTTFDKRTLTKE